MSRFAALLAFDARLLYKRALFRTVAVASILAASLAVLSAGGQAGGGWWRLAQAVRVTVPLLLAFGAILGSVSLAGDAAAGSLRGVLMRPVSRSAVVASRAIVLSAGLSIVYMASVLAAVILAAAIDRFDAVTWGQGEAASELVSRAELMAAAPKLIGLALPALVCGTLIGLMISACWNDPSSSAICGLLLVLSPYLVETFSATSMPWIFTHGATFGASVLSDLAEGVTTRLGLLSRPADVWIPVLVPLGVGVAVVMAGCAIFTLRDFRG